MAGTSFLQKFATCLVAALVVVALLLVLGNSGSLAWFPPVVVFSLVGAALLAGLVFPMVWQGLERRQRINSERVYGWLFGIIRYCLAFNIASFGWKKLFGLQFVVPTEVAAQPMNQQSGEWLTWYYFGYSAAFGLIIAGLQIVGAGLLLFRRTLLLGVFVLLAVMGNLVLINVFYHLNAGALVQSMVLTLGLAFLLWTERVRVVALLLQAQSTVPTPTLEGSTRQLLRLSALGLSLLFVWYLASQLP
ncbi:hypothetical protein HER32_14520 [Hymenobacter sp. BT18]|uniref:hypothetical protein n=1 Tax=Hymenobacter sp. BT18 TaxID=2835648 RepID=UPI00143EEBE0|nr:hypothetical protein [Hymenobacter sp. BT18]QIX62326.1 hypothetical protein HER32_14520 [Hymenobacter sp. BT18]